MWWSQPSFYTALRVKRRKRDGSPKKKHCPIAVPKNLAPRAYNPIVKVALSNNQICFVLVRTFSGYVRLILRVINCLHIVQYFDRFHILVPSVKSESSALFFFSDSVAVLFGRSKSLHSAHLKHANNIWITPFYKNYMPTWNPNVSQFFSTYS